VMPKDKTRTNCQDFASQCEIKDMHKTGHVNLGKEIPFCKITFKLLEDVLGKGAQVVSHLLIRC
jgi:hypothetical protein